MAIDSDTAYEPDALVNCGEKIPTGSMLAPAPVVVVEVVSPSSSKRDTGLKVEGYFSVATIAHYLVVDLAKRIVLTIAAKARRASAYDPSRRIADPRSAGD